MSFKYCQKCILPNTRPNINLTSNSKICDACATSISKPNINWEEREKNLEKFLKKIKKLKSEFDCIIPVSGGKDSTWQVIKALEYGLNPLCVTWRTPARNTLGEKNLRNLINLGVNHIDFTINPKVEKAFTLKTFRTMGSSVIPMHMALHAIPLNLAVKFKIPLIIWGENSAYEYGGNNESLKGVNLTRKWLEKYGVTNGTTAENWIDDNLTESKLKPYFWPSDDAQKEVGIVAIFLGYYFNWDPVMTFKVAKEHGFTQSEIPKTGLYDFADVDDAFLITIHHWMKWYKFGFTRLWDNLSIEIRNGRLSRDEAINIISERGDETPYSEIEKFCEYLQITNEEFWQIANSFRNKDIWKKDKKGTWKIDDYLIKDWSWK